MQSHQPSLRLHALATALIAYIAFLLAFWIRFYVLNGFISYGFRVYHGMAVCEALLHYAIYSMWYYPQMNLFRRLGKQIQRTALCEVLCMSITLAMLFLLDLGNISRLTVFIHALLCVVLISIKHYVVIQVYRSVQHSGYYQRSVLLIGEGSTASRYAAVVASDPQAGHRLQGCVASCDQGYACPYLGDYDHLQDILCAHAPEEAIIALPASQYVLLDSIIALCEKYGVPLRIIPCYEERISYQIATSKFEDIHMIGIRDIPLNRMYNAFVKRTFDLVLSLAMLIILSPLMLVTAIGVKLSMHDTIFFEQVRIGKNKKPFKMIKFRSMLPNTQENTAWSTNEDDRRTFFGALIRKLSIDELPQLFNVLRGDMSIVGPRPELPLFVEQFRDEIPLYMIRHMVKPGITGWAQVNGYRGDTSIKKRIEYDIDYIECWTIWVDLRILLRTIPSVVNSESLPIHKNKK